MSLEERVSGCEEQEAGALGSCQESAAEKSRPATVCLRLLPPSMAQQRELPPLPSSAPRRHHRDQEIGTARAQ